MDKDYKGLAEDAKRMAGNLANDLVMLRNLATTLSAKAKALEVDDDPKIAAEVASLMDRISTTHMAATPVNPVFDRNMARIDRIRGDGADNLDALTAAVGALPEEAGDGIAALLADVLDNPDGPVGIEYDRGQPCLALPCAGGKLVASFFGDWGVYDGLGIDFVAPDGTAHQCVLAEFDHAKDEIVSRWWDGKTEEPTGGVVTDRKNPDSAFQWAPSR